MSGYSTGYYGPMDREYFEPMTSEEKEPLVSMKDTSISSNPMIDQLQALKTRIFQGASKVELGFMGAGKGSMQGGNTTPEMYGKDQRQALRELAQLNDVELTTHATVRTGPLSGYTQNGFSDDARQSSLFEIQRAIDFAADVARGGPVVVHTQEWARSPVEAGETYGGKFRVFDFGKGVQGQDKERQILLADKQTGAVTGFKRNMELHVPEIDTEKTVNGLKYYKRDSKTGELLMVKKNYEGLLEELKKDPKYGYNQSKNLFEFSEEGKKITKTPEEMFLRSFYQGQYEQAHSRSIEHTTQLNRLVSTLDKLKKEKELYSSWEKGTASSKMDGHYATDESGKQLLDSKGKPMLRSEAASKNIDEVEKQITFIQEYMSGFAREAANIKDNMDKFESVEKIGLKKTAETIATAAMYAYNKEKAMKLDRSLFIAPENIFPEQYGSHPQELKRVVQESRKAMQNYLVNMKKMSPEEAKKIADEHIKGTFDVGHANTWRKYYEGSDADFNKWLLNEVNDLVKNKIIGHVHVSDNMGFEDEHLTPGQGNAPIKEFVKLVKDKGININVESAHQDFDAMIGAWRVFGSPITGLAGSKTDRWLNVEHSYFGKTKSPYFVFGEYSPSEDYKGSPFWSGLPLE